ncbi:hypothetical protein BCON_0027g00130 [Botryotinia convoluta]|uniref:Peptidase A1 domain-containing protein n=1 Tax=Botryotinia convoluta TaxID=54673 RepID=A0A4Z1IXX5_9HELO|nr:hypothetical protein BCON_0027g00130 [Botryotinia convoluta]
MVSSVCQTLVLLLLITLALAQVRIPITRKIHAPHPALNRRLSTHDLVSAFLANNETRASYVISVKVGTPPQGVDLTIDTGSSDTWLVANTAASCTGVGIPDHNGSAPVLCETPSDSFVLGNATIKSLQMGLANDTNIQTGILGIGYSISEVSDTMYPNILDELVSQNLISTRAYSLYLDSQESATGSLLFGAVDTTKFVGEICPGLSGMARFSGSSLSVELAGVDITDREGNAANLTTSPQAVLLDSGTTLTILPAEVTDVMFQYFSAYDDTNSTGNV